MNLVSVELEARPTIFVRAHAPMAEIQAAMSPAFATLDRFLEARRIVPQGPPFAIYHDWSGGSTAVDIGFPVTAKDSEKATGLVQAGMTPPGFAVKTLVQGSYAGFAHVYAEIDRAMKEAKVSESRLMWEIYLSDPEATAEPDLITEIYAQVSARDALKFPREHS
jgi:effector-binding domain-containing protein